MYVQKLVNLVNDIMIYYIKNHYIILSNDFYDIILEKKTNLIIISYEIEINFIGKEIAILNWETYSKEYKEKCFDANKIIIFSDKLKPTFVFPKEIPKNEEICYVCYYVNVWFTTSCCKKFLHKTCYNRWNHKCPFCIRENYSLVEFSKINIS